MITLAKSNTTAGTITAMIRNANTDDLLRLSGLLHTAGDTTAYELVGAEWAARDAINARYAGQFA